MIRDGAAAALAQAEFFDICDEEEQRMLAFAGDLRLFDARGILYQAGDIPYGAFVLISGRIEARPTDGGSPYVISEPGSVISAMALIVAKPRPVSFVALAETETLFVPRSAFLKLIQQSPDLAERAAARIAQDLGRYLDALAPLRQKMKGD